MITDQLIAPMLTTFKEDGNIDVEALKFFVNSLVEQKVSAIFPISGSGERTTLSFEEKKLIIKKVIEIINKRGLVRPGTGGDFLKESFELLEYVFNCNVDAVVIVIPEKLKPSEKELFRYFKEIDKCLGKTLFNL